MKVPMNRSAFTLIELMVSTGIILMMLAVSLPAYLSFQRHQALISSAQIVKDAILEAQNNALAPLPTKPTGADYYRIVFIRGTNGADDSYEVDEQQNSLVGNPSGLPTWKSIRDGILPHNAGICSVSSPSVVSSKSPLTDPNTDTGSGIFYSISQLGRVVKPISTGTLSIVIYQKGSTDQQKIDLQADTGRIDINQLNTPVTCS